MTYEQIHDMMQEMDLPFAYHHFAEGESPNPPFLLFLSPGEHTFSADNKTKAYQLLQNRFAFRVQYPCRLMQRAKHPTFMQMTACIMSSTTTLAILAT